MDGSNLKCEGRIAILEKMDYKDTNKIRYETVNYDDVENNIYALINPVGYYGNYIAIKTLRWYLKLLHDSTGIKYHDMRLLDVGCGDGHISRMMVSLLDNAKNIYAFDFSSNNVEHCKKLNPAVNYYMGNVVDGIPFEKRFDGITSFVVLSHLRKEEDVIKALGNIYNSLTSDGLFLWYELISKSHYINQDKDTQGFNEKELAKYANEVGFVEIARKSFSKTIWIGKRSKSIYYWAKDNNIWFLEMMAKLLPLRPTITIRIYKKRVAEREKRKESE